MHRIHGWLYRKRVAQAIALGTGFYIAGYLLWRTTSTLNPEAMWFSILLLAAEGAGFFTFILYAIMTWDVDIKPHFRLRQGWTVDVFVPTYNEDVDILEATLTGCNNILYPHVTYLLDDGRRPEVRLLAQKMGCHYLTRADNAHAKAGNINAALAHTSGEFIVVIDADTVPQPDFLHRTLGYFDDDRVAFVQMPQEFYNIDSIQHAGAHNITDWHEQALFYRVIQPGKNRWNAAFWCGSPSVLRRSALLDVGGVATETVTEDIHTSMRLHAKGWKSVYHNEPLAFGLAPETLRAFAIQRLRWAQGAMQMMRRREIYSLASRLTWAQRLNYVGSVFAYFESFQKLALMLIPPFILVTGLLPMKVDGTTFIMAWLGYYLGGALANTALGRGNYQFIKVEIYNLLKMYTFIWASTILVWPRRLTFKVTPKGKDETEAKREWRMVRMHLLSLSCLVLSLVIGAANLRWQLTANYSQTDMVMVASFWACVNIALMSLAVLEVVSRLHRRQIYRFPVQLQADIWSERCTPLASTAVDLSQKGVGLTLFPNGQWQRPLHAFEVGEKISVRFRLLQDDVTLQAEITRFAPSNGECFVGAKFERLTQEEREELLRFLFITVPRSEAQKAHLLPPISEPTCSLEAIA